MRMNKRRLSIVAALMLLILLGALLYPTIFDGGDSADSRQEDRVVPVAVAPVRQRPLDLVRTFGGALEPTARLVVAPKVAGRIQELVVDLGDPIERGQTVAVLDDAEFAQAVKQAEAELLVAEANLARAKSNLELARRENQRVAELRDRGIASDSEFDVAQANLLEQDAQVQVTEAQVSRAAAIVESARIRHGYTRITAEWSEGDATRTVAERQVDEGQTVSANEPLLLVVELDPIIAVISVTERDYGRLRVGLEAQVQTDAFPGEVFAGRIERIAPVFSATSRQARIELALANPEARLKPGMFIRAAIALAHVEAATVVPESALTTRGDVEGVFLVDDEADQVTWLPVEAGIRAGGWVQLLDQKPGGRVVTLGQHLLEDGARITIAESTGAEGTP
jgi:RND family efflux transporter MFP subunit